jgi:hypothetical protein
MGEEFQEPPDCREGESNSDAPQQGLSNQETLEFVFLLREIHPHNDDDRQDGEGRDDSKQIREWAARRVVMEYPLDYGKGDIVENDYWYKALDEPRTYSIHVSLP